MRRAAALAAAAAAIAVTAAAQERAPKDPGLSPALRRPRGKERTPAAGTGCVASTVVVAGCIAGTDNGATTDTGTVTITVTDTITVTVTGTVDATAFTQSGAPLEAGAKEGIFWENGQTVTANYTITSGKNAGTFGPVTINSGVTVTVPTGSRWVII